MKTDSAVCIPIQIVVIYQTLSNFVKIEKTVFGIINSVQESCVYYNFNIR